MIITAPRLAAVTLFEDGFESGVLAQQWSTSGTNTWRVEATGNHTPIAGAKHLVFDDSVDDATNSVAEATLKLDLRYKKNVELTFTAKSLGNEPHHPPAWYDPPTRAYDGVAVSTDGGATWRPIHSLASVSTSPTTFTYWLDQQMPVGEGNFKGDVYIRFSAYDNSPAPSDGIAIDDVRITGTDDPQSWVEMPSPLTEGNTLHMGRVNISFAPASDLTLTINASRTDQLALPASVVVPAGQTSVEFSFTTINDQTPEQPRWINVSATASGLRARETKVTVYDDEPPIVTIHPPAQVDEGYDLEKPNGYVTLSHPLPDYLQLNVKMTPSGQTWAHGFIAFYPGQTRTNLKISPADDIDFDGDVVVTITISSEGIPTATAQTIIVDNERRELSLSLPASVQEGSTATGLVKIPGYLNSDLVVHLTSSDATDAAVPQTVTIRARELSAEFPIQAADDVTGESSRGITITAAAETFAGAAASTIVRDNEVAGYLVRPATDIVDPSKPVSFTVSGADREGNKISGASGLVNVEIVQGNGTRQPAMPPTLTLTGTDTKGTVTLPPDASPPIRIRVYDAAARSGESQPFDFFRTLALKTADLLWDAARQRIYASVASDSPTRSNEVVVIDPVTAQITGSVTTGHNPGKLALTPGGEALYVALSANGTVARINPATMSVVSTFTVGNTPWGTTLVARDLCTLPGNPNLLLVQRSEPDGDWPNLALYDNGVPRQNTVEAMSVEPSTEADIVFAMPRYGYGLSRVQVNSNGLTVVSGGSSVYAAQTMVADRNIIADLSGKLIDGANLRALGSFFPPYTYNIAAVAPEMAARRVYFVEPSDGYAYLTIDRITAYDSTSFAPAGQILMPAVDSARSLIRWGASGLAFSTTTAVVLVNAAAIVPRSEQTDLGVTVEAQPATAAVGQPIIYQVELRNQGAQRARDVVLVVTLSAGQIVRSVDVAGGQSTAADSTVTVRSAELAPGAVVSLNITAEPQQRGSVSCTASVTSQSVDGQPHNDAAVRIVPVGFESAQDVVNRIQIRVNNALHDPARDVIWASVDQTTAAPLGRSVVAIDPHTGEVSDPIPLNGDPRARCMALSPNGRYLYVGYADAPAVARVDLHAATPHATRLYLGSLSLGHSMYPEDLEVLDGDGTSFIVAGYPSITVFDGEVPRPSRGNDLTRIERTGTPNVFVAYRGDWSSHPLSRLVVGDSGVSVAQTAEYLIDGTNIVASGDLVLSDYGYLAESGTLTRRAELGMRGTPCIDAPNNRAHIVYRHHMRAFDATTGNFVDALRIPTPEGWTYFYNWANQVVRWGSDGFAVTGPEEIFLTRWSGAVPSTTDQDDDGVSDAWETKYFGRLDSDLRADPDRDGMCSALEYFFGTSPTAASTNPLQMTTNDTTGGRMIHLIYRRREDVARALFGYETSTGMAEWTPATGVTESIIGTQEVDGVRVNTIDAAVPAPSATRGFVRLKWLGR